MIDTGFPRKFIRNFSLLFRPLLHGNGSMWGRTRTVRIGLAFTRELMEPFHIEPLAVPELVHLESRSRTEPNQKVLAYTPRTVLVRSLLRSVGQVRLETRQGERRLRIDDNSWKICSRRTFCLRLRRTNVWLENFFKNFLCS